MQFIYKLNFSSRLLNANPGLSIATLAVWLEDNLYLSLD